MLLSPSRRRAEFVDPLISAETIALVRERTDILAVVSEAVPSLKRRGRSHVGLCPFHKEKSPSFHVNPDRGFFHCFGCHESGSAIDFLIKHDGLTFPEAVRDLAERAGITIEETRSDAAASEADRQRKAREDLYAVNALAATYFEEQLRRHEHRDYALEELEKRALVPGTDAKIDDALQAFRIGYAPPGWDGLTTFLRNQGISPTAATTVGLLVPRSSGSGFYDRFRHRLMFAVMDPQGRVVAFSGRSLRDMPEMAAKNEKGEGGPTPKYINSPESPIYTKGNMLFGIHQARHAIRQEEEAVLVEGNFDVVSLHARGVANVVAPLGTAFTPEQAKLLKRFAPSVVFLFDGDAAGKKAVRLSREPIRESRITARVATLPDGIDPDQLSRDRGVGAISDLVAHAKGMLEALIEMALDDSFAQADALERQTRIGYVVKLIAEEDDPVVRAMAKSYSDMIAGRLDIVRSGDGAFQALEKRIKDQLVILERQRQAAAQAAAVAAQQAANQARGPASSRSHSDDEESWRDEAPDSFGGGGGGGGGWRDRDRDPRQPYDAAKHARLAPKAPGTAEKREIIARLIEWPSLLEDPEVQAELAILEGPSVMLVAALRRSWNSAEKRLDTDRFLTEIQAVHRKFVAEHLSNPTSETENSAKVSLLDNAKQLKRLLLSQEAAQITRETYRAQGDWDAERELLREAADRLRAKHGLKR